MDIVRGTNGGADTVLNLNMMANVISPPNTMGGNTRIFLEFARRWAEKGHIINAYVSEPVFETCKIHNLTNVNCAIWPVGKFKRFGALISDLAQVIIAVSRALRMPLPSSNAIIYSASDFWPDVLSAVALKKKWSGSKWIASLYLLIPSPFKGFEHAYDNKIKFPSLKMLLYYAYQRVAIWFMTRYADLIFVTNDVDKAFFVDRGVKEFNIKAIYGGVELEEIAKVPSPKERKYDGCFVGRIHPMKGVLELVQIWDLVCQVKSDARLALIGNGAKEFEDKVRNEIKRRRLEANIEMLGYVDGKEKYSILKSSRVFLHSSIYDNCAMAAAEAMACGLPAVRFDIPALRVAYPKGMLVAPLKDCETFAQKVLELLGDDVLYAKMRSEALEASKDWDWDRRASSVLRYVTSALHLR